VTIATATMTVGALRRRIAKRLKGAGDNGALEARLLVAHALGRAASTIPLVDDLPVDAEAEARAFAYADRRAAGEPVARITGVKEFWGREFGLSPETLVPRPDTETVVEAALAFVDRTGGRHRPLTILDLGTGSGAILLSLLGELPQATGLGIDRSEGALRTAAENAVRLGLGGRARFVTGDWAKGLAGRFDVVVANPPYIESAAIDDLPVDVRLHDPHLALDGGRDGLDAYRSILADLGRIMGPEGRAFLEIGAGQRAEIEDLGRESGFATVFRADLAGIDRVAEMGRFWSRPDMAAGLG
jgi:release factor glutamine methyltransferase